MPHRPIGDHVMTPAERQQRRRDKLKTLRNAAPQPADPVLAFHTQRPDEVAARICARIDAGMARNLAIALRQRLWQNSDRPDWRPPPSGHARRSSRLDEAAIWRDITQNSQRFGNTEP